MSAPTAKFDDQLNLVVIESPHGLTLTPQEAYELYLVLRAVLPELPQPLKEPTP